MHPILIEEAKVTEEETIEEEEVILEEVEESIRIMMRLISTEEAKVMEEEREMKGARRDVIG